MRSYIKINNLPAIDPRMPIISAKLTFSYWSGTTTGKDVALYKVSSSWNPTTITYANQPIVSSLLGVCSFDVSTLQTTFDITNDFARYYIDTSATQNYGYQIRYVDESNVNPDDNAYYSSEYYIQSQRPVMTVVYEYTVPSCFTNGTVYSLQNVNSQKFLNVHYGYDVNETNVYQWTRDYSIEQNFRLVIDPSGKFVTFKAMCSSNGYDKVLDIVKYGGYNGTVEDGCNVEIYSNTAVV